MDGCGGCGFEQQREHRDPEHIRIATLIHPVCAETKSEAEDKRAAIEKKYLPRVDEPLAPEVKAAPLPAKGWETIEGNRT